MANDAISSADSGSPELDNEQRYMALLALTSQELPNSKGENLVEQLRSRTLSTEELQALYARLDADPAALESFLRLRTSMTVERASANARVGFSQRVGRWFNHSLAVSIDRLSGSTARYATAFGVMAIVATLLIWQRPPLTTVVEQGFTDVSFNATDVALKSLTLPWERSRASLGFSAPPQTQSPSVREFANGLIRAKQKLLLNAEEQASSAMHNVNTKTDSTRLAYFALGEWNVLLWAACESDQPRGSDFWRRQLTVQQALMSASYEKDDAVAVHRHLTDVATMLGLLGSGSESGGENSKRNARRLADELLRFREELASAAFAPREVAPSVER